MVNVNILVSSDDGMIVDMYTYFPYTPMYCNQAIPTRINRYINGSFVEPIVYADKLRNMHNCPLYVTPLEFVPFVLYTRFANGSYMIQGIEFTIVQQISVYLNFTVAIQAVPPQQVYAKTIEVAFQMVMRVF